MHTGQCICGAVQLEASGSPEAMGYCHCASCREWSGAPLNAFTLWKPDSVKITKGAEHLGTFKKTRKPTSAIGGTAGNAVATS